ncbi:hypothetical protein KKF84_19375 [Myxococcota bacterium]|nr:hypothetical protein [Myxococcota bacterium]MBU1537485.1 hypothetical protein [Myxococcota bacterium]
MVKILLGAVFALSMLLVAVPQAEAKKMHKYQCYRHHKGKVKGKSILVWAYSKTKAQNKAFNKFKSRGLKVHYAKCYRK